MRKKILEFARLNPGFLFLAAYGIFSAFYKTAGSFATDEAIYGQVARESLLSHSFLILHWQGLLWFEKPPLFIWLTALAFKLFGFSEAAARVFPGLFSLASTAILYFLARDIFKSKMAGFFSGFIFLTIPLIHLYSRSAMMDIPVGTFDILTVWGIWKIFHGETKWWLTVGLSLGLSVMTKSVVGFLPLALFPLMSIVLKKYNIYEERYFWKGLGVFFLISLPWHAYMTWRYGQTFWDIYLGFHVFSRFFRPILPHPWQNNSPWAYFTLLEERSGLWIWVFLILTSALLGIFFISIRNKKFNPENVISQEFISWAKENKKGWFFLYGWLLIVFLPFLLAETKLPNYMVLVYYPLSILTGGFLAYLFKRSKPISLFLLAAGSLLNFLPELRLRTSDFGEAHIFFPESLIHFLHFGNLGSEAALAAEIAALLVFFRHYRSRKNYLKNAALAAIIGMNLLVPFSPLRNEFIKKLAGDINGYTQNRPIVLYIIAQSDYYAFNCVSPFYLPPGSRVKNVNEQSAEIIPKQSADRNSFCFFEKNFLGKNIAEQSLKRYQYGALVGCRAKNF
ncbi:MAG: glycosyltransferase family 39 protein [Candidatus Pacebacteria bacterium]|nr:glycosyltransferase family 39 protein [Candidatus Paceibacterota bacterium]